MANPYSVSIRSISTDGTNLYVSIGIFDGLHTLPPIMPVFPVGTSAATIQSYMQNIANNQPTLTQDIANLVNTSIQGQ